MAQYMLLIYDDERSWSRMSEDEQREAMGAWFAYTDELKQSGAYVAGDALQPTATARTVRFGERAGETVDGPFAETKEQLGGYYLVDVATDDEALAWARKIPLRGGSVEVRPVVVFPETAETTA